MSIICSNINKRIIRRKTLWRIDAHTFRNKCTQRRPPVVPGGFFDYHQHSRCDVKILKSKTILLTGISRTSECRDAFRPRPEFSRYSRSSDVCY